MNVRNDLLVLAQALCEASNSGSGASDGARTVFDRVARAILWLCGVRFAAEDLAS